MLEVSILYRPLVKSAYQKINVLISQPEHMLWLLKLCVVTKRCRESSGSVVECLTRDRGAAGLSLTGITELWSLSKTHLS